MYRGSLYLLSTAGCIDQHVFMTNNDGIQARQRKQLEACHLASILKYPRKLVDIRYRTMGGKYYTRVFWWVMIHDWLFLHFVLRCELSAVIFFECNMNIWKKKKSGQRKRWSRIDAWKSNFRVTVLVNCTNKTTGSFSFKLLR